MHRDGVAVIAEVANAHEGDVERAMELVDAVARPADAVKFQKFTADELALPSHPDYETFAELEMSDEDWATLVSHVRDADLAVFADVFGEESIELMAANNIDAYKIHNADVSNTQLLERVSAVGAPVFLSAGGSTWIEIADALDRLGSTETTLLYGYQNYPTAVANANLNRMVALQDRFDVPVGYASHAPGDADIATKLPKLAVAAGASAVEVHVTLDRSAKGTDHYSALEPDEFATMAAAIRDVEPVVGNRSLSLPANEREYRENHKKWLVAIQEIDSGDQFTPDRIGYKRLSDPPIDRNLSEELFVGKTATKGLSTGDPIMLSHMDTRVVATLACRNESTRLYGKPLQLVGEEPILGHLVSRLLEVAGIDDIVLAIADTPSQDAFIEFARERQLDYVIGSEENVLGRLIAACRHADGDIAIRVTTENPFLYHENVKELLSIHRRNNCDLTLTRDLPLGASVEVVSLDALEKANQHGEDRHRSELCTLFVVENPDSFEIQTVDPPAKLRRPDLRLTVDNPEDLVVIRDVWENARDGTDEPSLEEVVEYLDANDHLTDLQADLPNGTDEDIKAVRPFMYGEGDDGNR
jgi:N,N'-diacetyllegionaminate synthase